MNFQRKTLPQKGFPFQVETLPFDIESTQSKERLVTFLNTREALIEQKHARLRGTASPIVRPCEIIAQYVLQGEAELSSLYNFKDSHTHSGLLSNIAYVSEPLDQLDVGGYFLSDTACERILLSHPPRALMKHHKLQNVADLLAIGDARDFLALTRHTENKTWQTRYHDILRTLCENDFVYRRISTVAIDSTAYAASIEENGHAIKAWKASHSKETGIVTFFTHESEDNLATPNLLLASIYLHYFFETNAASTFISHVLATDTSNIGPRLAKLIKNNRASFSFLKDKNVYDETLYWDKALAELFRQWDLPSLAFFVDTHSCDMQDENEHFSFNLIDVLWDLNLPQSRTTTQASHQHYTYHALQSLWTEFIYKLSPHCISDIHTYILHNLDHTDSELTQRLLQSHELN